MAVAKGLPHVLRNDWDAFRLRPYGQKASQSILHSAIRLHRAGAEAESLGAQ